MYADAMPKGESSLKSVPVSQLDESFARLQKAQAQTSDLISQLESRLARVTSGYGEAASENTLGRPQMATKLLEEVEQAADFADTSNRRLRSLLEAVVL